jgi:type I restriction-modification system DNA methylase subunit
MDNFNIIKIVQLDENFFNVKGIKFSILYFKNDGKTTNVQFNKLQLGNLQEIEEINVSYDMIKNTEYQLYSKLYMDKKETNNTMRNIELSELCSFCNIKDNITSDKVLTFDKYYTYDSINISDTIILIMILVL